MALQRLWSRLQSAAASATDPTRAVRVKQAEVECRAELSRERSAFNFNQFAERLQLKPSEKREVALLTYQSLLQRAWQDRRISEKERHQLNLIARLLQLSPTEAARQELDAARQVFGAALEEVFRDGEISDDEVNLLNAIAEGVGLTVDSFVAKHFRDEVESLVRAAISRLSLREQMNPERWRSVRHAAARVGLDAATAARCLAAQARTAVEQSLANAKQDGRLDADERSHIESLLAAVPLAPELAAYIRSELARLQQLTDITDGRMPTVLISGFMLDAGERGFFEGEAVHTRVRQLRSGVVEERTEGTVAITDTRLMFKSDTRSFEIRLRRVLSIEPVRGGLEIRSGGRADGCLFFRRDPDIPAALLRKAVSLAKQTSLEATSERRSRSIPRDVRQRVWQAYGGACAECGATDYLEFDHIVPVAKGGSNSEQNVQLLCRRCNLRKSDRI